MALRRGLVGVCARLGEAAAAQSSLFCTAEAPTVAAPTLRAVAATWNVSWKGFSSCSARQQQAGGGDGDQSAEAKAAEATSTAAEQQQPEGGQQQEQPEKELTMEECLQAFNALQEELEAEKKKTEEMKDRVLRTMADMENLRDRTQRNIAEAKTYAVQGLVKSLLEVADNLERAAGAVPDHEIEGNGSPERALSLLRSLRDGVLMTEGILLKILAKEGVTRYDPTGEKFDPNLHMALFEVPDATKEPGTVAIVIKKGYLLHDRAVRAAEVGVAKATEENGN